MAERVGQHTPNLAAQRGTRVEHEPFVDQRNAAGTKLDDRIQARFPRQHRLKQKHDNSDYDQPPRRRRVMRPFRAL